MKPSIEIVEATANAIMEKFIPKDPQETTFCFHFTIPPAANYKAEYKRDPKGNWALTTCVPDPVL